MGAGGLREVPRAVRDLCKAGGVGSLRHSKAGQGRASGRARRGGRFPVTRNWSGVTGSDPMGPSYVNSALDALHTKQG